MLRFLRRTWSKWSENWVSSMCLDLAWKTGLAAKWVALSLSYQTRGGTGEEKHNSWSTDWTRMISEVREARPWYYRRLPFVWYMTKISSLDQGKHSTHWYLSDHLGKKPNWHLYNLEDKGIVLVQQETISGGTL